MTDGKLPPEIVSLIHHVQLNKLGWWEYGLRQIILGAIFISDEPISQKEIVRKINDEYFVNVNKEIILDQIEILNKDNKLHNLGGRYTLPRSTKIILQNEIENSYKNDLDVKRVYEQILRSQNLYCKEDTWDKVKEEFLKPYIWDLGATTFNMFASSTHQFKGEIVDNFICNYPDNIHDEIRNAIRIFFNTENESIREYITRILNAFFFVEASGLSRETLEKLENVTKDPPKLIIYVDTNILFSALGLHESPSNSAVSSLMDLIDQILTCPQNMYQS